ncbi:MULTISPECIES: ATP-binding cassette domain-containing protein [Microbacterium]|uniref:ATP-binding cassette domain-containing protein n=1 Tax=Microbacterium TaxID=33882 RepID=UPI00146B8087|nr:MULTISPECIES: ATP-binding cassette domain-containing protein [Microbacterium]
MPEGQVLEFSGATKRFGRVTAVSEFTARVEPGLVTGFLGPNGAGKTTSLRLLLGLVRPSSGAATIGGVRYGKLKHPLQTVGAVLEASSFHPGRTGHAHLRVYAQAARIPTSRVDDVLGLVGLEDAAGRKVGGYSLGMRQRLGLAYALLGDPGVLVLDEPTNGLDPEGIKWIRGFLRQLAREGRTVFVSSHLLAEVQQTVDALLIISAGRLVFQGSLEELSDPSEQATVVDSADRAALAEALRGAGIPFEVLRSGLTVRGIEPVDVGLAAAAAGVPLSALHKRGPALEEVFLDLVNGTRVHASASGMRLDDVIPAIESGPITVLVAEEQVPDASAAARDDSAPRSGEPGDEPSADDEDLPEARPDQTASAAAELDAEASFAVAGTGVVDIIPAEEREGEPTGDEPAEGGEVRVVDGVEGDAVDDGEVEDVDREDGDVESEPDDIPEGDEGPEADDRSWDRYVKTDADLEADRFFAAFDRAAAAEAEERAAAERAAEAAAEDGAAERLAEDGASTDQDEVPGADPGGEADEGPAPEAEAGTAPESQEDEASDPESRPDEGGEQR